MMLARSPRLRLSLALVVLASGCGYALDWTPFHAITTNGREGIYQKLDANPGEVFRYICVAQCEGVPQELTQTYEEAMPAPTRPNFLGENLNRLQAQGYGLQWLGGPNAFVTRVGDGSWIPTEGSDDPPSPPPPPPPGSGGGGSGACSLPPCV